jgi:hypothetical protein
LLSSPVVVVIVVVSSIVDRLLVRWIVAPPTWLLRVAWWRLVADVPTRCRWWLLRLRWWLIPSSWLCSWLLPGVVVLE